jgi:hypothetical protein
MIALHFQPPSRKSACRFQIFALDFESFRENMLQDLREKSVQKLISTQIT